VAGNRWEVVVAARVRPDGGLDYATSMLVPPGSRVELSPRGDRLLLISEDDRDLPPESAYRLNRGLRCVRLADLDWHDSIDAALRRERRDDRYPEARFVPDGAFDVLSLAWKDDGCEVRIRDRDSGTSRRVTVRDG
jgi:hypothetical protein